MSYSGLMGVDWEDRIDFRKMRDDRLAKAQDAMKESQVDALILFRWENTRYATGQRYVPVPNSPFEHCATFVVLTQNDFPYLFTMDVEDIKIRAPWIPEDHILQHYYVQTGSGARAFARHIKELGLGGCSLGVDLWEPTFLEAFQGEFGKDALVNGQDVMIKARSVKTNEEIKCLKVAYSIGEAALQAGLTMLKPGARECELQALIWKRAIELGAEWLQSPAIVTSKANPYRRFTSDNIILEGDAVIFDVGPVFNGYFSDFVRTWYCGEYTNPPGEEKEAFKLAYEVLQNVIRAMKPGATTGEVFRSAGKYVLGKMLGHGIGLAGQEPPFITEEEAGLSIELKPGMVFSVEPYVRAPGNKTGFRLEEHVLITEKGPEVYSTFPHGPYSA